MRTNVFSRKDSGIALIFVLLLAVVVSMLALAMLQLSGNSKYSHLQHESRTRALQACYSGLDYAKSRLKEDQLWGSTVFDGSKDINLAGLVVNETGTTVENNVVRGKQLDDGQSFEVQVRSNLTGYVTLKAPNLPIWSDSQIEIPSKTALIRVTGHCGAAVRHMEVLVARSAWNPGSIYAGQDLYFEPLSTAGKFSLGARLPKANRARVTGNVYLPNSGQFEFNGSRGTIQSGLTTYVNSSPTFDPGTGAVTGAGSSQNLQGAPALLAATQLAIQGRIELNAPPPPAQFSIDSLKSPSTTAKSLLPGQYFIQDGGDSVKFFPEGGGSAQFYTGAIDQGSGSVATVKNYQFSPTGPVTVAGNFTLATAPNADETTFPATLALGYDENNFPIADSRFENRLEVKGNLTVAGDLAGSGQLLVKKNGSDGGALSVRGNSYLSTTRTTGMAISAEKSIHIQDVSTASDRQPFAMSGIDLGPFKSATVEVAPNTDNGRTLDRIQSATTQQLRDLAGQQDFSDVPNPPNPTLREAKIGSTPILADIVAAGGALDVRLNSLGPITLGDGSSITGQALIGRFITESNTESSTNPGFTLGHHLRLREFIKSVMKEPAAVDTRFVDRTDPNYRTDATGQNSSPDRLIEALAINQMITYDQDARAKGKKLRDYLSNLNSAGEYLEVDRRKTVLGGLMHSMEHIWLDCPKGLSVLGMVLSQNGTVHISSANPVEITNDPGAIDDHLDLSKVGFDNLFFWADD